MKDLSLLKHGDAITLDEANEFCKDSRYFVRCVDEMGDGREFEIIDISKDVLNYTYTFHRPRGEDSLILVASDWRNKSFLSHRELYPGFDPAPDAVVSTEPVTQKTPRWSGAMKKARKSLVANDGPIKPLNEFTASYSITDGQVDQYRADRRFFVSTLSYDVDGRYGAIRICEIETDTYAIFRKDGIEAPGFVFSSRSPGVPRYVIDAHKALWVTKDTFTPSVIESALRGQLEKVRGQLRSGRTEIDRLNSSRLSLLSSDAARVHQCYELRATNVGLRKEVDHLNAELVKSVDALAASQQEIGRYAYDLDRLREQNADLVNKNADRIEANRVLTLGIKDRDEKIGTDSAKLVSLSKEIVELSDRAISLEQRHTELMVNESNAVLLLRKLLAAKREKDENGKSERYNNLKKGTGKGLWEDVADHLGVGLASPEEDGTGYIFSAFDGVRHSEIAQLVADVYPDAVKSIQGAVYRYKLESGEVVAKAHSDLNGDWCLSIKPKAPVIAEVDGPLFDFNANSVLLRVSEARGGWSLDYSDSHGSVFDRALEFVRGVYEEPLGTVLGDSTIEFVSDQIGGEVVAKAWIDRDDPIQRWRISIKPKAPTTTESKPAPFDFKANPSKICWGKVGVTNRSSMSAEVQRAYRGVKCVSDEYPGRFACFANNYLWLTVGDTPEKVAKAWVEDGSWWLSIKPKGSAS